MNPWFYAAGALVCLLLRFVVANAKWRADATGLLYVLAPMHAATFALRRKLSWSRGPVRHVNEPKEELFAYAGGRARELEKREHNLRQRYDLERFFRTSSREVYRENAYLLDVLDRQVKDIAAEAFDGRRALRAIDVGSKDFRYAYGLARWLRHAGGGRGTTREVSLTGIELDGSPIYSDLHTRKEHGEAYARSVDRAEVTYETKDFLGHDEQGVDVAFVFFPFVLEYALVRWGLPRSYFLPERIMKHVHQMVRPGGLVVVMNHTEEERVAQVKLLEATGLVVVSSERVASDLVEWAADFPERSLTVARVP